MHKEYPNQLTHQEQAIIDKWSGVHLDVALVESMLKQENPLVVYDYQMLYRELNKAAAIKRAREGEEMTNFMRDGKNIARNGGLFDVKVDGNNRLYAAFRQSKRNKAYLMTYDEYLAMDGTHHVDRYGHLLIIGTVQDCLGMIQAGFSIIAPGEDGAIMSEGVDMFGVSRGKGTLHSDGAPWGALLAAELGRDHQLCSDHFITEVRHNLYLSCRRSVPTIHRSVRSISGLLAGLYPCWPVWTLTYVPCLSPVVLAIARCVPSSSSLLHRWPACTLTSP